MTKPNSHTKELEHFYISDDPPHQKKKKQKQIVIFPDNSASAVHVNMSRCWHFLNIKYCPHIQVGHVTPRLSNTSQVET